MHALGRALQRGSPPPTGAHHLDRGPDVAISSGCLGMILGVVVLVLGTFLAQEYEGWTTRDYVLFTGGVTLLAFGLIALIAGVAADTLKKRRTPAPSPPESIRP